MQYRFAEFVLDLDAGTVFGPDGAVPLRQRAFQLLCLLVRRAPSLLTRDEILDEVWGHDALSPAVLAQTVGEIRQALGDRAQRPRLIETKHRRGYRLIVPVRPVPDSDADPGLTLSVAPVATDGGEPLADPAYSRGAASEQTRWRLWLPRLAAGLLVLSTLALAVWLLTDPGAESDEMVQTRIPATRPSLALVLTSNAAAPDWLAQAGVELLSTALANDDRVQLVRGDGRSEQPGRNDVRWQTWLREVLGADYAVTGVWRQHNGQLRLNYSLIALESGQVLHSAEQGHGDLASLGQAVAADVRRQLRVVDGDQGWMVGLPRAEAAREAYYRGLAALADGDGGAAIEALEQAAADRQAGPRVWLTLAAAYRTAGRLRQARAQFERIAGSIESLSLGERLRMEAEAALADHRPADAAASLRALHGLMPDDREVALTLLDAQIRARQVRAAGTTLASLEPLAAGGSDDPRWYLAQARLAQLQHDPEQALNAAQIAAQRAEDFGLDELAVQAQLELVRVQQNEGRLEAAREHLQGLLERGVPTSQRAEVQVQLGNLLRAQGQFDSAEPLLLEAETAYAERGDRAGELLARIERHIIDSERGHSEQAYQALLELEPEIEALGDAWMLARYHNTLGVQAIRNHDLDGADRHLQRAASESRRAGQPRQEAGAYNNLAMALARGSRLAEAKTIWQRALTVFQDSGDRRGEAITLGNLASIANLQGDLPRSRDLNRQALVVMRELGMKQDVARLAFNLGLISEREGELADAQALVRESLDAYVESAAGADFVVRVAAVHVRILTTLAELAQAREQLELARGFLDDVRDPIAHSHLLTSEGDLLRLAGDVDAARAAYEQARALRAQDSRSNWAEVSELDLLSLDLQQPGSAEQVRAMAERIVARADHDGEARTKARGLLLQARALHVLQRPIEALPLLDRAAGRIAGQAEVGLSLEVDRLRILTGQGRGSSTQARLHSLADEAERRGFVVFALECRLDAEPDNRELRQRIADLGLAGLLRSDSSD